MSHFTPPGPVLLAFTIQSRGLQTLQGGIEDPNDMAGETHLHSCFRKYLLARPCARRIQAFWRCQYLRLAYKQFVAANLIHKAWLAELSLVICRPV
jgi:hypothetical protein